MSRIDERNLIIYFQKNSLELIKVIFFLIAAHYMFICMAQCMHEILVFNVSLLLLLLLLFCFFVSKFCIIGYIFCI